MRIDPKDATFLRSIHLKLIQFPHEIRLESLVTLSNFHPGCIENHSLHPCGCAVDASKVHPKSVLNPLQFYCVLVLIVVGRMLDVRLSRNPEFRLLGRCAPVAVNSGLRPETPL